MIDNLRGDAVGLFQVDLVSHLYVLQPPEEAIPMTGDSDVSVLAEECSAGDVTDSTMCEELLTAVKHWDIRLSE